MSLIHRPVVTSTGLPCASQAQLTYPFNQLKLDPVLQRSSQPRGPAMEAALCVGGWIFWVSYLNYLSVLTHPAAEQVQQQPCVFFNSPAMLKASCVAHSWTVPSNIPVPALGGESLFGQFLGSIGQELSHFPRGPALDDRFWCALSRVTVQ